MIRNVVSSIKSIFHDKASLMASSAVEGGSNGLTIQLYKGFRGYYIAMRLEKGQKPLVLKLDRKYELMLTPEIIKEYFRFQHEEK